MGFISNVADRVRGFFRQDKEQLAVHMAKGSTSSGYPASGYDLLQAYGYDVLSDYLKLEHDLLSRYVDYEEADDIPEISKALDIYADDSTVPETQINRSIWVESQQASIQQLLDDLLHKTLRMDEEIWEISRSLCKYGGDFEEILVTNEGVRGLNFLPAPTVRRIEGPRGELFGYIQDFKGRFGFSPSEFQQLIASRAATKQGSGEKPGYGGLDKVAALEDWEVVHLRLRSKHRRSIYGYSVLEAARWIIKRLLLMEDAALIYRLQRAPERYAFYVDVGDLPPQEALAYLNRVRQQHRKTKFFNPTSGKIDLKMNPLSQDEDFFLPSRKGQDSTRVEVLAAPNWQHMEDIEYFRDKLFSAIGIPKSYMGQEAGVSRGLLSSQDVRFARSILRVQRELRNGMGKICRVHMAALNIDPYAADFDVRMTVPSSIFELAQLEVRNARADLANRMKEFVSHYWLLSNVFGLNDADIQKIVTQREEDTSSDVRHQVDFQSAMMQAQGKYQDMMLKKQADTQLDVMKKQQDITIQAQLDAQRQAAEAEAEAGKSESVNRLRPHFTSQYKYVPRYRAITEKELFNGGKDADKKASDKLETLLKNDKQLAARLLEVGSLLHDLRDSRGTR